MKPIPFPEQTMVLADKQEAFRTLPAFQDEEETISLWRLSWRERLKALITGRVWLRQRNCGEPLQPQLLTMDYPFEPTRTHRGSSS